MNRLRNIRGGTGKFNIVSIPIYLLIILAVYLLWKYAPLYWQREGLIDIAQHAMLAKHKRGLDAVATAIIEDARYELNLKLNWNEVDVFRRGAMTIGVEIWYEVVVKHPFMKPSVHVFHVKVKRKVLG